MLRRILNDFVAKPRLSPVDQDGALSEFTLFMELPLELRVAIWRLALPKGQRIISIVFGPLNAPGAETPRENYQDYDGGPVASPAGASTSPAEPGSSSSSRHRTRRYAARLDETLGLSPSLLLSVDKEARQVALEHDHAYIPFEDMCPDPRQATYRRPWSVGSEPRPQGPRQAAPALLRFPARVGHRAPAGRGPRGRPGPDPGHAGRRAGQRPEGDGVLHIGIGGRGGPPRHLRLPAWDEETRERMPRATQALRESIALFRSVTFIDIVEGDARLMFRCWDVRAPRFNRAVPAWSPVAGFHLFDHDELPAPTARPASGNDGSGNAAALRDQMMEQVHVGDDPRRLAYVWRAMETSFGARTAPGTDKRVFLTAPPRGGLYRPDSVRSRDDAVSFLKAETHDWKAHFREGGCPAGRDHAGHDRRGGPPLVSAVGFWLLPLRAFGPPQPEEQVDLNRMHERSPVTFDLRAYPPCTGLFDLPADAPRTKLDIFLGSRPKKAQRPRRGNARLRET